MTKYTEIEALSEQDLEAIFGGARSQCVKDDGSSSGGSGSGGGSPGNICGWLKVKKLES